MLQFKMVKDLQQANVKIEPALIRRLQNAQQALEKLNAVQALLQPAKPAKPAKPAAKPQKASVRVAPGKKQPGDNQIMQGVGALALAVPIVALKGLPAALKFITKYSLPKLNQGIKARQAAQPKLKPQPQPKPGLRPRLRAFN
jgi:hypothetical protein